MGIPIISSSTSFATSIDNIELSIDAALFKAFNIKSYTLSDIT